MLVAVNQEKEIEVVNTMFRLVQIIIEQNQQNLKNKTYSQPRITIMNDGNSYLITFNKNMIGYDVSSESKNHASIYDIGDNNIDTFLELSYVVRAVDGMAKWEPHMKTTMMDFIQTKALLTEFVHKLQNNTK